MREHSIDQQRGAVLEIIVGNVELLWIIEVDGVVVQLIAQVVQIVQMRRVVRFGSHSLEDLWRGAHLGLLLAVRRTC